MEDPPLYLSDGMTRVLLEPMSVQRLGRAAELDQEVAGQVLGLDLASFLPPELEQGRLVVSHDDPGVRTPYKTAAVTRNLCRINPAHVFLRLKPMNVEYQMIYEISYDRWVCQ
jgi:hypothetical protein